jgi:hypothetical protein
MINKAARMILLAGLLYDWSYRSPWLWFGYGPFAGYSVPGLYYYCADPPGYSPAVASCPGGWRAAPPPPCTDPPGTPTMSQCRGWIAADAPPAPRRTP